MVAVTLAFAPEAVPNTEPHYSLWLGFGPTEARWELPERTLTQSAIQTRVGAGVAWGAEIAPDWRARLGASGWLSPTAIEDEEFGARLQTAVPFGGDLVASLQYGWTDTVAFHAGAGWAVARLNVDTRRADGQTVDGFATTHGPIYVAGVSRRLHDSRATWLLELRHTRYATYSWPDLELRVSSTALRTGIEYAF